MSARLFVIIVDTSGSMNRPFSANVTYIEAAKSAVELFCKVIIKASYHFVDYVSQHDCQRILNVKRLLTSMLTMRGMKIVTSRSILYLFLCHFRYSYDAVY
jgi:hypothetical protein